MTEFDPDREFIDKVVKPLKTPMPLGDSFEVRVMSAVHGNAKREIPERWWQKRYTLRFTPLGGLAIAASIFGIMFVSSLATRTEAPPAQTVHFILVNESAKKVHLVGDFNGWSKTQTPLKRATNERAWTVSIPLAQGKHEYAFIVTDDNGDHWVADPLTQPVEDEFGTESSIVRVGAASS